MSVFLKQIVRILLLSGCILATACGTIELEESDDSSKESSVSAPNRSEVDATQSEVEVQEPSSAPEMASPVAPVEQASEGSSVEDLEESPVDNKKKKKKVKVGERHSSEPTGPKTKIKTNSEDDRKESKNSFGLRHAPKRSKSSKFVH